MIFDVRNPANISIIPCPNENRNNIITACIMFADSDANPIIPAKIGVEQGVPASAKTAPKTIGYKIVFVPLFCGICLKNFGSFLGCIANELHRYGN